MLFCQHIVLIVVLKWMVNNMPRYIERNLAGAVIKKLVESDCTPFDKQEALDNLYSIPTVDVQEIKHGKWSKQGLVVDEYGDKHIGYICSVCKNFVPNKGNYCLECGAKMDGE